MVALRIHEAPNLLLDPTRLVATMGRYMEYVMTEEERIAQLERTIADLNARMPKHSVPAAMIIELEELEEELEALKAQAERGAD